MGIGDACHGWGGAKERQEIHVHEDFHIAMHVCLYVIRVLSVRTCEEMWDGVEDTLCVQTQAYNLINPLPRSLPQGGLSSQLWRAGRHPCPFHRAIQWESCLMPPATSSFPSIPPSSK